MLSASARQSSAAAMMMMSGTAACRRTAVLRTLTTTTTTSSFYHSSASLGVVSVFPRQEIQRCWCSTTITSSSSSSSLRQQSENTTSDRQDDNDSSDQSSQQQHHHHRRIQELDQQSRPVVPQSTQRPSKFRRYLAYFFIFGAVSGAIIWTIFDLRNARVLTRCFRTLVSASTIMYMYKFTTPESPEEISAMNARAANALLDLCLANEGLYIKLGQQIHSLNQILPPEYGNILRRLLDDAPPVPVSEVQQIVLEDLGAPVEELFVDWNPVAVASASIAQVHRAKLRTRDDGILRDVAVKVQKPQIRKQMWWDIQCNFLFSWSLWKFFGLPTWWSAQHIAEKLSLEVDFTKEADHIDYARKLLLADCGGVDCPSGEVAGDVYVPKVFREALSPRVLVTEWIESNRLHETEAVKKKFDVPGVVSSVVRAYADLIFTHGFIHADPHPANVLVRPHPKTEKNDHHQDQEQQRGETTTQKKKYKHQVVFIDWGLAVEESDKFRHEYARLFKAVFMREQDTIEEIVGSWGISDPGLFASMMLQKPISLDKKTEPIHSSKVSKEKVLLLQQQMKEKATTLLEDESKTPKELILLGRGMNLIRSINKSFGAPVNRVNILAERAARSLGGKMMGGPIAQFRFQMSLAWISFVFHFLQWYGAFMQWVVGGGGGGGDRKAGEADATVNLETMLEEAEQKIVEQVQTMRVSERD